ncbi:MAG: glycosyltransferase [Acidimicrobiales bacterium]
MSEAVTGSPRRPIRAALCHLLPPGGAVRVMTELVERTGDEIEYDEFTVDLGEWDRYPGAADGRLAQAVGRTVRESVCLSSAASRLGRGAEPLLWRAVIEAERRLAERIDAGGYDVVIAHNSRYFGATSTLRSVRTPSVYYAQEPRRQSYEYELDPTRVLDGRSGPLAVAARGAMAGMNLWLRSVDVASGRAADRILCNSAFSAEAVARAYGRVGHVSPLGTDLDRFTLSTAPRSGHVLSVGALVPAKGHDLVVEAIGRLPVDLRPTLVIPNERGDARYRETLEAMATARGVTLDVRAGISDIALNELYGSAIATVCAAHLEPFGLSVPESLATGTPVIAVAEGGFRETVEDGVTGFLVERDAARLADALATTIASPDRFDPAALRERAVQRFSWAPAVETYLGHVREVAGRTGEGDTAAASVGEPAVTATKNTR